MKYRSTDAWILSIGVRVDCQGSGIGRSLSQELIEKQHALGATTVSLSVAPNNEPAIRLYQLLGFQVSCEIDNYFGPHEPRILMQKHLQAERSC